MLKNNWMYIRTFFRGKVGFAKLLTSLGFIVLVYWLFHAKEMPWLEPFLTLILLVIACLTGKQIFSDLSDLRAKSQSLPLESYEDPTTEPWGITNHSIHEIRWNPETTPEHRQTLRKFWRKQYANSYKGIMPQFDRLLEETATINFRVISLFEEIRFLRIHKAPLEGELECRQLVAKKLKEANIFPEDFVNCLIPLKLNSKSYRHVLQRSSFAPATSVIVELFPYAKEVTHFAGLDLGELADVGRVLGSVQQVLQRFDKDTCEQLTPLISENRNRLRPPNDLKRLWEKIQEVRQNGALLHPFAKLLIIESDVEEWVKQVIGFRCSSQDEKRYLLLHDVHPHNVFCKNGKCVLIYDYQWLGYWPHGHVVAFALHRFVRELVMKKETAVSNRQNTIKEGVSHFLTAYRESCDLPLPDNFRSNLKMYIRSSNMDKFLDSFWIGLSGQDKWQRSEARLLGEARKFIRYMKEAEQFT